MDFVMSDTDKQDIKDLAAAMGVEIPSTISASAWPYPILLKLHNRLTDLEERADWIEANTPRI